MKILLKSEGHLTPSPQPFAVKASGQYLGKQYQIISCDDTMVDWIVANPILVDLSIGYPDPAKYLLDQVKQKKKQDMLAARDSLQNAGYTCSNGIKLQVRESDLSRWTQLTTTLTAFQPAIVNIRDYDDVVHNVSLAVALTMMGEVAAWGQSFLAETWALKDAISACTTFEQLEAITW